MKKRKLMAANVKDRARHEKKKVDGRVKIITEMSSREQWVTTYFKKNGIKGPEIIVHTTKKF